MLHCLKQQASSPSIPLSSRERLDTTVATVRGTDSRECSKEPLAESIWKLHYFEFQSGNIEYLDWLGKPFFFFSFLLNMGIAQIG